MVTRQTAAKVPESFRNLFEKRAFAYLATLMPDGTPQLTPLWVDYDGTHILVNSAKGRVKDRNMRKRPAVAIVIQDPDNPYRYLGVRGRVVEIDEEHADAHIDKMAKKYLSLNRFPHRRPGMVRRIYKILPVSIDAHG
jgi:PPOX class probable F420-dependent enzyme